MNNIYFANLWTELFSIQGLEQLNNSKWQTEGNWLKGKYYSHAPNQNTDLIIYSPLDGGLVLNKETIKNTPTLFWGAYPDYLLGWDFKKNAYLLKRKSEITKLLPHFKNHYTVSNFAKKMLEKTYALNFSVLHWGVPTTEINKIKRPEKEGLKVLWNHMWRQDKGFDQALKIILNLAKKYPQVSFFIGRKEKWAGSKYSPISLKQTYYSFLIKKPENVHLVKSFPIGNSKRGQKEYYRFLKSMDISFSTSFHEGFGLGMLEQAAAKIACVLPSREVYPELYHQDLLVDPNPESLTRRISQLIESKKERQRVQKLSYSCAQKYSTQRMTKKLLLILKKYKK